MVGLQPATVHSFFGIAKEVRLQFVLSYDPVEFAESLRTIAEGTIDVAPMITKEVCLEQVGAAFGDLARPDRHCRTP